MRLTEKLAMFGARAAGPDPLVDLADFGPNPGALRARAFVPDGLAPGAALVVALHGCTQDAAGYAHGTGWTALAERQGFAVLLPEQARGNNPNGCFNWFQPGDVARHGGEAESIASMVRAMVGLHAIDPARVFVTGLSAGGAMAAAMCAAWPELFAGGAVIGGLPYGAASGVPQALDLMRGGGAVSWTGGGREGPWPAMSIWHGGADATVAPINAERLAEQWRAVHGLDAAPALVERGANWERRTWRGRDGRAGVERWMVAGMGHGVPVGGAGPGAAGPFFLDVGLSSTAEIARGWGLVEARAAAPAPEAPVRRLEPLPRPAPGRAAAPTGPQAVIEGALRAAGLLR